MFVSLRSPGVGDLDRFSLLRESLQAFGYGGVSNYALVNTEDEPMLRELHLADVVPVTAAQLLAPEVDGRNSLRLNIEGFVSALINSENL